MDDCVVATAAKGALVVLVERGGIIGSEDWFLSVCHGVSKSKMESTGFLVGFALVLGGKMVVDVNWTRLGNLTLSIG